MPAPSSTVRGRIRCTPCTLPLSGPDCPRASSWPFDGRTSTSSGASYTSDIRFSGSPVSSRRRRLIGPGGPCAYPPASRLACRLTRLLRPWFRYRAGVLYVGRRAAAQRQRHPVPPSGSQAARPAAAPLPRPTAHVRHFGDRGGRRPCRRESCPRPCIGGTHRRCLHARHASHEGPPSGSDGGDSRVEQPDLDCCCPAPARPSFELEVRLEDHEGEDDEYHGEHELTAERGLFR